MDSGATLVCFAHLECEDGHQDDDSDPDEHSDDHEGSLCLLGVIVLGQDALGQQVLLSLELLDLLLVLFWVLRGRHQLGRLW